MVTLMTRRLLAAALLFLATLPPANSAWADSARQFDIPGGPLGTTLSLYAADAGILLSFDAELTHGKHSSGLRGRFTTSQGFDQLLSGHGLSWRQTRTGTFTLSSLLPLTDRETRQLGAVKVEIRDDLADEAYRSAGSVNVLNQRHIERFRGTSVGDMFQGTPGVLVGENRNSGGLDVNIRGMQGQGRVPVLIDGSRQETTVYRGYAGVSSRSYIDPDLVGSVRIDKGPVLTAQGTGATGGVVSVSTLTANDVIAPGKDSGLRLRGTLIGNNSSAPAPGTFAGYYSPRNSYRTDCRFASDCTPALTMPERFAPDAGMDRPGLLDLRGHAASLAGAHRFSWGDLLVAYAQRDQGNYYAGRHGPTPYMVVGDPQWLYYYSEVAVSREGVSPFRAGERIPNTQYSSDSWLVKARLMLPQDQGLELSYIRYDSEFGEMMPSQIRLFGQARQWLGSEVLNQTYTSRYNWNPAGQDLIDLDFNVWHTDAVSRLNTPAAGSVGLASNTFRKDDYQRYGTDLSNTMHFYPIGELRLDYGVAMQWERMTTDTPDPQGFYAGARSGKRDEFSAFTALRWRPWPAWTLEAGTRFTRFKSHDNKALTLLPYDPACRTDGDGGCLPVYYRNRHSGSAPIAALTWEPLDGLQFYARYAEGLRMPSLFESTSGWSVSPVLDIPLRPEHAINREFGTSYLRHDLLTDGDQLRVKLAYFRNHTKDYLTRTQPNAWEVDKGTDFFRMRNIDSADFRGWELNLEYDAGRWFTELGGTRYQHIEVCNTGSFVRYHCTDWGLPQSYVNNMIPPKWHASATLGMRLLQQRLELGARGTFMGLRTPIPRYNAPVGFNPPVLWHRYQVYDLFARYQVNDTIALDLTVDNVTDRYYLDALSLGVVPAPGRTARFSATLQF